MCSLVFYHDNRWQAGTLLKGQGTNPRQYWFILDAPLLCGEEVQYLCFFEREGKLIPAKIYAASYQPLLESIRQQIEGQILRDQRRPLKR